MPGAGCQPPLGFSLDLVGGAMESMPVPKGHPGELLSVAAFQCGQRVFTLADVFDGAEKLGVLPEFRESWKGEQIAAARNSAIGCEPAPEAIETQTNAFRYARDLVSAEECERWLAQFGLDFEDLTDSISRRLQGRRAEADSTDPIPSEEALAPDDSLFLIDAALSEDFPKWARQLAWRLALAHEAGTLPAEATPLTEFWPELNAQFEETSTQLATPQAQQRALSQQWLNLTQLKLEVAEFDSHSAAAEATCCVREDDCSLAEVAQQNHLPCEIHEQFLEALPPEWQASLQGALTGNIATCATDDTKILVLHVLNRREPRLDDEAVSERLSLLLVANHFRELESRHVRWLVNLEATA